MKQLPIDLSELELAFDEASPDYGCFLDTETGEVFIVENYLLNLVEELIADGVLAVQDDPPDLSLVVVEEDIPDWQAPMLVDAYRVETRFPDRCIRIAQQDSQDGWDDMAAFVQAIGNDKLTNQLEAAIQGRGAFSRFQSILGGHPKLEQQWYSFRDARQQERMIAWLKSEGITVIEAKE